MSDRLEAWLCDWDVSARQGFPHYATPRELKDDVRALLARCVAAEQALAEIKAIQPEVLETLRSNGVVFAGPLGNDPTNMEHVAFTIYTQLCRADWIAKLALDEALAGTEAQPECDCHAAQHPAWKACPIHGTDGPVPDNQEPPDFTVPGDTLGYGPDEPVPGNQETPE